MKKALLLAGALLALTATVANAQLNLMYDDCGSGVTNKNDACTANTGTYTVHASCLAPAGSVAITGEEGVVDIQVGAATVPAWWQAVVAGSCRGTAVKVAFNTPGASCMDYFGTLGGPLGGFGYDYGLSGQQPDRIRIKTVSAIDAGVAGTIESAGLAPGDDMYVFTMSWTKAKTVGTGLCAGCTVPACIVFNSVKLTQPVGVGDYMFTTPATGNYVSWQGGAVGIGPYGQTGCPGATPATKSSWGQVKSLYR